MKYLLNFTIAVCFFFPGCMSFNAVYDIGLKEVVTPEKVKEKYGNQNISKIDSAGIARYYFENDMVKILWLPTSTDIYFTLTNKTDFSIKVIWDDAAFVDETGKSHRVMHEGVKYIDRSNPEPPTVVPRKGSIDDLVYPTDYAYFVSGQYGGWDESPLFPNRAQSSEELKSKSQKYVGKTFQVLLPLQIQDVTNEYTFTFQINGVQVKQ